MGWRGVQVRAAVPMYILARNIKAMGIKVVLSGEGADEALGGYLFFHKAPSPEALHSCARSPYALALTRPALQLSTPRVYWHLRRTPLVRSNSHALTLTRPAR